MRGIAPGFGRGGRRGDLLLASDLPIACHRARCCQGRYRAAPRWPSRRRRAFGTTAIPDNICARWQSIDRSGQRNRRWRSNKGIGFREGEAWMESSRVLIASGAKQSTVASRPRNDDDEIRASLAKVPMAQINRSFLVLFFKKERLASYTNISRIFTARASRAKGLMTMSMPVARKPARVAACSA